MSEIPSQVRRGPDYQDAATVKRRPNIKRLGLLGASAIIVVLAIAALKLILGRPGEGAIQLVPADADIVVTLDTNPSPGQLATFKYIYNAVDTTGIEEKLDDWLDHILGQSALAPRIQPYVAKSFAYAAWGATVPGPQEGAFFLALTDPGAVNDILDQSGERRGAGGPVEFKQDLFCGVIGNYLVVTRRVARFKQILMTFKRDLPSFASLADYQSARSALPSDANLMFYVCPSAGMTQIDSQSGKSLNKGWVSGAVTVRGQGLEIKAHYPSGLGNLGMEPNSLDGTSIDRNLWRALPDEALAIVACSQSGKLMQTLNKAFAKKSTPDKTLLPLEQSIAERVLRDYASGLPGDFLLGIYPGASGIYDGTAPDYRSKRDVDSVLCFDAAAGSNPAGLAQKFREACEHPKPDAGNPSDDRMKLTEEHRNGATLWWVDADAFNLPQHVRHWMAERGKRIGLLLCNRNLYVVSSNLMADRVLAVAESKTPTLMDDPLFSRMLGYGGDSQVRAMVALGRLIDIYSPWALRTTHELSDQIFPDAIHKLFGRGDGNFAAAQKESISLVAAVKVNGSDLSLEGFLPLDYFSAAQLLSTAPTWKSVRLEWPFEVNTAPNPITRMTSAPGHSGDLKLKR